MAWRQVNPWMLVLAAVLAHATSLWCGFTWDDPEYVVNNPLLRSTEGLHALWFQPLAANHQWYPLTLSSFWLQWQVHGDHPLGYHAVNVALHALNAVLAWRVLEGAQVRGAFVVALLFAVHPVHVESVAWVTERKNVLSAAFYLASALAWLRFSTSRARATYAWALLLFACALLSKTVTATLPAVLLLLAWRRHGAFRRADVLPLLPFLVLALLLAAVTVFVERDRVGAVGHAFDLGLPARLAVAGRAPWFYAGRITWPAQLVFMYPRWDVDPVRAWMLLPGVVLLALMGALYSARHRVGRGPLVALLVFVGTLFPALGFINVYPMRFTFVADHYVYLASIPLLALLVAAGLALAERVRVETRVLRLVTGLVACVLALLSAGGGLRFRDAETLWRDTVEENPGAWQARTNLAAVLLGRGELDEAEEHLRAAVADHPDAEWALNNLGLVRAARGDLHGAVDLYRRAIRASPGHAAMHLNLGLALERLGQPRDAEAAFRQVLRLQPGHARAQQALERLGAHAAP